MLLSTTKSYDNLQRLTGTSSNPLAGTPVSSTYTYNTANQRTQHTLENGEYWDYSYDDLGQVTGGAKKLSGGTTIPGLDYSYAFDEIGNRETGSSALSPANDGAYTADALNQYSQRTVPRFVDILGTADPSATVTVNSESTTRTGEHFLKTFDYSGEPNPGDARLDLYSIVATLPGGGSGGADAVAEEEGEVFLPENPESFTYDDDGNLLSDGQWNYTWNGENRLISMETASAAYSTGVERIKLEFVYDSQGRRISKQVYAWDSGSSAWVLASESLFLYDGWNLIWEQTTEGSENTEKAYVWGLDLSGSLQGAGGVGGLLQMAVSPDEASTETYFPAYDGNGNVVALFDETGTQVASYEYGPFGEPVGFEDNDNVNPFRFSTKYWDEESGLNYYGFRYYSPETGRWLNRDPIEEEGGLNLYGFIGNGPVNAWDYLGLSDDPCEAQGEGCDELKLQKQIALSIREKRVRQIIRILGGSSNSGISPSTGVLAETTNTIGGGGIAIAASRETARVNNSGGIRIGPNTNASGQVFPKASPELARRLTKIAKVTAGIGVAVDGVQAVGDFSSGDIIGGSVNTGSAGLGVVGIVLISSNPATATLAGTGVVVIAAGEVGSDLAVNHIQKSQIRRINESSLNDSESIINLADQRINELNRLIKINDCQ